MSYKRVCDCCGKDVTRTLFHYTLKGHFAMEDEDLCRECYYTIREIIRNSISLELNDGVTE